ncbi:MAG: hypothetical protein ABWY38_05785 [Methyloceanibacter sp.]
MVDWASPQVASYDTPLKRLFSQSARAFSSGCVRVERVFALAAGLLGTQKGTLRAWRSRSRAARNST